MNQQIEVVLVKEGIVTEEDEPMYEDDELSRKDKLEDIIDGCNMESSSSLCGDKHITHFLEKVMKETELKLMHEEIHIKDEQLVEVSDSDSENNSNDKIQNEETNSPATEEYFVSLVEKNRALWDKSNRQFKNEKLKENIWEKIGNKINISGVEAASLFKSIRLKYVRRKNDLKKFTQSGSGAKPLKPWRLYDLLQFLDDTITPRRSLTNILRRSCEQQQHVTEKSERFQKETPREDPVLKMESKLMIEPEQKMEPELKITIQEDDYIMSDDSPNLSRSSNICSGSSTPTPIVEDPIIKPVQKRKRQDDALDMIAAAISAPLNLSSSLEDSWTVSKEVKHFCKFISYRLNEMPKKKQRKAEMRIINIIKDVEDE